MNRRSSLGCKIQFFYDNSLCFIVQFIVYVNYNKFRTSGDTRGVLYPLKLSRSNTTTLTPYGARVRVRNKRLMHS